MIKRLFLIILLIYISIFGADNVLKNIELDIKYYYINKLQKGVNKEGIMQLDNYAKQFNKKLESIYILLEEINVLKEEKDLVINTK